MSLTDPKRMNELLAAREAARAKAFITYQRVYQEWYALTSNVNASLSSPPAHLSAGGNLPDPRLLRSVTARLRAVADEIDASIASNDEWRAAAAEAALAGLTDP
jgi:phytoene dehydrogenase-like protein